MKRIMNTKTAAWTILMMVLFTGLTFAGTFEVYSEQGCLDIDGSYLIGNTNGGDLVQLIWAGADKVINDADEMGNVTGDDVLVAVTFIGYGTLTGLDANGRFGKTITSDALVSGRSYYIRVWNTPVVSGLQDACGKSALRVMANDVDYFNFGQIHCAERMSTPVELSSFNISSVPGKVILKWTTESETENLGFHIYKSTSIDGEKVKVTDEMINGAINSQSRNTYQWEDNKIAEKEIYYYWLADISTTGDVQLSESRKAIAIAKPENYSVSQNYPNPFNPTTSISYSLKDDGQVKLYIYNVIGQQVRKLVDGKQSAGVYDVQWDGRDENGIVVPSGIYFYNIQVNEFKSVRKMSLTK